MAKKDLTYKSSRDGKTSWGGYTGKLGFPVTTRVQTHDGKGRTKEFEYSALGPGGRGRRVSK